MRLETKVYKWSYWMLLEVDDRNVGLKMRDRKKSRSCKRMRSNKHA